MRKVFNYMDMRGLYFLILVCSLFGFGELKAQNPQLKSQEDAPPQPSVCGVAETYTVTIQSGATLQSNIDFRIVLPEHFEYDNSGVQVTQGGSVTNINYNSSNREITMKLNIPASADAQQIKVSFKARVLCGGAESADVADNQRPRMGYYLGTFGSGNSQPIIVKYAVLQTSVAPQSSNLPVSGTVERTITVRNGGQGAVQSFKLVTTIDSGLEIVSSDLTGLPNGWTATQDTNVPGTYQFSGGNLAPGQSIAIKQVVKVKACSGLTSSYKASYGCTPEECTSSNINNTTAKPTITADKTPRPNLDFKAINPDGTDVAKGGPEGALCLDRDVIHIWRVENKGTAAASDLEMTIYTELQGSETGSTYFIQGSDSFEWDTNLSFTNPKDLILSEQTTWAGNGERFNTNTQWRYLKAKLDDEIPAGKIVYVRFKTRNNSYKSTVSCEQKSKAFRFGSIKQNYTYKNANICSNNLNFSVRDRVMQGVQTIGLDGVNTASVMVSDNQVYDGRFVFSLFNHGDAGGGIKPGDYFDVVLELSPSLSLDKSSLKMFRVDDVEYIPEVIEDSSHKYRLRLKFGNVIYKGTSDKQNGQHNQPQSFISFKATYKCGSATGGDPAWYKLHMESNKATSCSSSTILATQCMETKLTPTGCVSGCDTGFSRGIAKVERHPEDYGYNVISDEPDSRGLAAYPLTKATQNTAGVNPSAFHTNDRIWVSQVGTVLPITSTWSKGIFNVDIPTNAPGKLLNLFAQGSSNVAIVNANGGRLKLTRGTSVYEIDNLPVVVVGNKATLEFDANVFADKGVATFQLDDKLEAFIEIRPNNGDQSYKGTRVFETDFYLVDSNNVQYRCGPNGRANSLFVTSRFRWFIENQSAEATRRLVNCGANLPMIGNSTIRPLLDQIGNSTYFRLNIYLNELIQYNAAFPRENRRFLTPKQVVVTVPSGLDLEGFYVQLSGMGGSNYAYYRLQFPAISGTNYTLDVQDVLKKVLEARYSSVPRYVNGMTIPVDIDEGYWIRFTPVVKKNCYSRAQEDLQAYVILDGTGRNVDGEQFHNNETNIQTHVRTITYFVDNDKLTATVAQPVATSNTEEVKWVVKVDNTSTFHTFQNLWLGSEDMTITSVQETSDAAGQNVIGSTFVNSGGIFQLGDLSSTKRPPTRYFVVTANVPDCGTGNKNLVFGHSCTYPNSVTDACSKTEIPVSFIKTEGTLQLRILKQPLPDHAPALCELLEYDIEINNSGRGQAKEIQVRIPLGLNSGLTFEPGSAKLSTKYTTTSVEPTVALADSNISVTTDEIIVTIPNEALAPVEKIRLSLQLRTTSDCNFNLSNQIAFIPSGKNYCGSDLTGGTNAISNRLRYRDDVTNNPKVEVNQSSATIVFSDVLATGNPIAKYSLQITNIGEGANQDDITENNAILAIKLPMGWEFVNTTQVEASSGNKLKYQSYDSVTNTYFYQVITNIPVNDVLGIIEAEMTTQSPQSCPISGNVEAMLYYNVPGLHSVCDNAIGGFSPCTAKKTLAQATTPMTLTIPDATLNTAISTQFCNNATVADLNVLVVEKAVLAWYNSPTGGTALADNTPLTTGIYYVSLRDKLVLGCESLNRTPVTITIVNCNPIVANDDMFISVNGNTGGSIGNVLSDNGSGEDTLNNNPATTTNVIISEVVPANSINGGSVPALDTTTGNVTVPAGTPAGTYTIVYRICESGNSVNNCDTATVTVVVSTIEANDDDMSGSPVNGVVGNPNVVNVLTNDILNGVPNIPIISDITITVTTQATPIGGSLNVPVLDPATGNVSVPAGTPAGTYTIVYKICTSSNICDTANVVVVVTAQPIDAKDDTFAPVVGITGGKAGNVLSDNGDGTDTLGNVPATTANVDISVVTPASPINGNPNVPTLEANTGDVNVPANTPAGTYTIVYRICDKLNSTNCDTATATVVVNPTDLEAVPDDFSGTPIRGTDGGNTPSVLTNDKLNGTPLNPSDVTLTWGATPPNGFTPNTDGTITIAPNTPAGTYTLTYTICEKLNPTNCETTTVTVLVTASPIVANDDDYTMYPIYTTIGGTVSTSVLVNDTIEGVTATLGTVTISNPTTPNTNIYIDTANGMVVVLPNTPVGTYTLTYIICEKANPTNCSNQANVTVVVLDVPKANDDSATTEINTPVVVNILENDQNVPTTGRVSVVSDPSRGSVQVNDGGTPNDPSDDTITYTPNPGFVGTDTFVYELCDAAGNCSNATVTIEVVAGGDIIPYNAISTNDDGSNDIFYIKGIEGYPNNTVRIYNRWGVKVFEAQGYNNTTKVFRGLSNGRVTIEAPEKLPQGTYYYIIEYVDKNNQTKRKGSWLYIKN